MAHTKNKVVEYLKKHLNKGKKTDEPLINMDKRVSKYLENTNLSFSEKQTDFLDDLREYYSIESKEVFVIVAGLNFYIKSKNVSNLKKENFRSLIMAFKTLSECVDIAGKNDLPKLFFEKYKKCGATYADEWNRRAEKLLKSKGESNAVQEKDLVKHNLLQSGSVLNDNFWKSQKEYFEKLDIREAILDDIKKVYQKCS